MKGPVIIGCAVIGSVGALFLFGVAIGNGSLTGKDLAGGFFSAICLFGSVAQPLFYGLLKGMSRNSSAQDSINESLAVASWMCGDLLLASSYWIFSRYSQPAGWTAAAFGCSLCIMSHFLRKK